MKRLCLLISAFSLAGAVGAAAAENAESANLPYKEIISSNADCRELFWNGVAALGEDDLKAAASNMEKAVGADNNCFLAYILLSQIAFAQGDEEASRTWFKRMPQDPPEVDGIYDQIRDALRADDFPVIAKLSAELVRAYPQTITAIAALHLLGRAQYWSGNKDDAFRTLRAAYMYSDLAPGTVPAFGTQAEINEIETFAGRR
jgi:tetratricopeptide (TPR) repeat protein